MSNSADLNPVDREADLEALARQVAREELRDSWVRLGVDIDDPDDVIVWHKNKQWIERRREAEERMVIERRKLIWGGVVTIIAGAILSATTGLGKALLNFLIGAKS